MSATTKKVRLTLEIEVTAPVSENHERAIWTAGVAITPTLPGVTFGLVETVGVETEDEDFHEEGVKALQSSAQQATETKPMGAPLMPSDAQVAAAREGRATAESHEIGLTLPITHQFGIAFGLWGYSMDVMWNGKGQGENPDLIAIEESRVYAEVVDAIETQDPTYAAKKEVAGVTVWVEEKPSMLYSALRDSMFAAYRWAAYMPKVAQYGVDRLTAPNGANTSWTFSADLSLESPDLFSGMNAAALSDVLVAEGIVRKDQVRPPVAGAAGIKIVFPREVEASAFVKLLNRWLFERAIAVARRQWTAREAART